MIFELPKELSIDLSKISPKAKFEKGDRVVIIDHSDNTVIWDKGEIVDKHDDEEIYVWVKEKCCRIRVNDRQIMAYDDAKDLLQLTGIDEGDFTNWEDTDWGDFGLSRDLPPTPDEKCSCEMQALLRYGCQCEVGKKELEDEAK